MMQNDLGDIDMYTYFSTAAGPDMLDLYGPPGNALDMYADGSPIAASEAAIANNYGSSKLAWYKRPDVHSLIILSFGALLVHLHMES